jgi:hypothetical protein
VIAFQSESVGKTALLISTRLDTLGNRRRYSEGGAAG